MSQEQQSPAQKRGERIIRLAATINAFGARGWSDAMKQATEHVDQTTRKKGTQ
jgi:hypothetical protein